MNYQGKNALVAGMQSSGVSASNLLKSLGANVTVMDDKLSPITPAELEAILPKTDIVVISPAIPNTHPLVSLSTRLNVPIISEMELGISELSAEKIMITGTNGKTTTVQMVEKLLTIMGKKAMAMGNIGYPVSQVVLDKTPLDYAVIEASSFQLEYIKSTHAKIAVLLNLSPDHMDRYASFRDYVAAKEQIFTNLTAKDYAVLNYDCKIIRAIGDRLRCKVIWVSTKSEVGDIFVKDNYYYFMKQPMMNVRESAVRGEHNRFNFMTAMYVGLILGAKKEHLMALVREYSLSPHRIEYVCSIGGKSYFNDSKGTNIGATVTAVKALEGKVGLILGGSDKNEEYFELFEAIDGLVECVAVTGSNADKIVGAARKVGFMRIKVCDTLKTALEYVSSDVNVENVLFSPASASFDRYKNYAERGEVFKQLVYATKI